MEDFNAMNSKSVVDRCIVSVNDESVVKGAAKIFSCVLPLCTSCFEYESS